MKKPLVKYQCRDLECWKEFITVASSRDIEKTMSCPFCKNDVEAVVGHDEDAQDLYEEMGCLYPGGGEK